MRFDVVPLLRWSSWRSSWARISSPDLLHEAAGSACSGRTEAIDGCDEVGDAGEVGTRTAWHSMIEKNTSTRFRHDAEVGVKCNWALPVERNPPAAWTPLAGSGSTRLSSARSLGCGYPVRSPEPYGKSGS